MTPWTGWTTLLLLASFACGSEVDDRGPSETGGGGAGGVAAVTSSAAGQVTTVGAGGSGVGGDASGGGKTSPTPCPQPAVELYAAEPHQVRHLAVDATHVFFTVMPGMLRRVPRCGGAAPALFDNDIYTMGNLVVDDAYVYFATSGPTNDTGELFRVPKMGGAAATLADGLSPVPAVAVDETHVYFSNGSSIRKVPKAGGVAQTLATGADSYANLVVHDGYVYFPGGRVPIGGGAVEALGEAAWPSWCVGADATRHFWTEYDGEVHAVPVSGGPAMALLPTGPWRCMTTDADFVYAASDIGLWRVGKDGSQPSALHGLGTIDVAVDDIDVFFTTGTTLVRHAKQP